MSYRNETIQSATIMKREAHGLAGSIGIKHYGIQMTTTIGNTYVIHSTPGDGTVCTDVKLSYKWTPVQSISVVGTKTVGDTFSHSSGRTTNKFINYMTSGTCIGTTLSGSNYLSGNTLADKMRSVRDTLRVGGIKMTKCIQIEGELNLSDSHLIPIDDRINFMDSSGRKLINHKIQTFDKKLFDSCLLMSMNGKTLFFSVSLDPFGSDKLQLRLHPEIIVRDRLVGTILFECDWILKCLTTGTFHSLEKGVTENRGFIGGKPPTFKGGELNQLRQIGYKSHLEYELENNKKILDKGLSLKNYNGKGGRIWLEPDNLSAVIKDGLFTPDIKYKIYHVNSEGEETEPDKNFSGWLTNNFAKITEIFPIFAKLDELFLCFLFVLTLRKQNVDLSLFEESAVKSLEMIKYMDHKFEPQLYEPYWTTLKDNYKNSSIEVKQYGGISNPFSLIDRKQIVNFQIKCGAIKNMVPDSKLAIKMSGSTQFRLRYGFEVNLNEMATINDLYNSIRVYLQEFPEDWFELSILDVPLADKSMSLVSFGFENGDDYELSLVIHIKESPYIELLSHLTKEIVI